LRKKQKAQIEERRARPAAGGANDALPAKEMGTAQRSANRRVFAALALIAFAVFISYGNTLKSEFIHDDRAEILQNPFVWNFSHILQIFTTPAWTFGNVGPYQFKSNYYRPVQYFSYAILYRLFGPEPWGYHVYKLLSHLTVCLLFFWILWSRWQDYTLALSSSLLFAVHPGNTEAVSWVSGITDTSCALFFLLSFLVYLQDRAHPSAPKLLLLSLLVLLGLLSKETMASFPIVIFAYDWLETGRFPRLNKHLRIILPLLATFGIYLILRIHAIGGFTDPLQIPYNYLDAFQLFLNQLVLLSQYVVLFFLPVALCSYHLFNPVLSPFNLRFGIALLILAASLLGFLLIFKRLDLERRKPLLLGLLWFVVTLLPVLVFLKRIGDNVFAERYFYLPSLGLCLSSCLAVMLVKGRFPRVTPVVLGLLLATLAWRSIDRNRVWQTELMFYETTAKESPMAATILNSLGTVYVRQSRYQDSIKAFESSIAGRPSLVALKNLANVYATVGRHEEAIATYQKVIALDPLDSAAYAGLGDVFFTRGQYTKAIENYKKSLACYPESTVALFKFADACIADQRYDEAIQALQTVLALSPAESSRAYRQLAKVYESKNLPDLAAEANRKASFGPVHLFR